MTDQTIIEQVARLDERIAEHRAHIAKIEAQYGSGTAKLDERCAGIVLGFDQVLDLRALLTTLQSSAVLPSEAITDDECPTCQGRGDVWTQSPGLPRNPQPEQCGDCYGTGRTNPTAPVQDDNK